MAPTVVAYRCAQARTGAWDEGAMRSPADLEMTSATCATLRPSVSMCSANSA
jgi:hypothetical protein